MLLLLGALRNIWETPRVKKDAYVYSISVSEIIYCGEWPLDKKQFRYNLILIFSLIAYIFPLFYNNLFIFSPFLITFIIKRKKGKKL